MSELTITGQIFLTTNAFICVHLNFPDHSLKDLSVQAIDTIPTNCLNSLQELQKLESYWIQMLKT